MDTFPVETLEEELMRMSDNCGGRLSELLILASVRISKQKDKIEDLKLKLKVEEDKNMF